MMPVLAVIAVLAVVAVAAFVLRGRRVAAVAASGAAPAPPRPSFEPRVEPPAPKVISIEPSLYEPHGTGRRGATMPNLRAADPLEASRAVAEHPSLHRPLTSRFRLPESLTGRLSDPDDAVALVAGILEEGGLQPERRDDLLLVGDMAVVVVDAPVGEPIDEEQLTTAYVRFEQTGCARGIVVTPGLLNVDDVHRRERLDPRFLHAGLDGIQRMADAVVAGGDPLRAAPLS